MAENKELKKAYKKLKTMSEDEEMQRFAEWRQDAIYMENTLYSSGLKEGEKIGEKNKQIEIALNMIKVKLDIELISKTMGFTKEEIENISS